MKLRLLQTLFAVWFLAALFDVCWLVPPILLAVGDLWEVSPSHSIVYGLTSTGGFIFALYAIGVLIVGMALFKAAKRGWHEPGTGCSLFIYVSILSYVLPVLEWTIGTCTVSLDFSGMHVDCESGLLATLPGLLASSVLMVTALAIHGFTPKATRQS